MNSFTDGSAFCPGASKRVPSDSAKHRRVYMSSNVYHSHEWRVDTASGKTLKKRNACLHAVRHAVGKKIACIHGLRSEGVKKYLCVTASSLLFTMTTRHCLSGRELIFSFILHAFWECMLPLWPNAVSVLCLSMLV